MNKLLVAAGVAALALSSIAPARAAIRYDFTALSAYAFDGETFSGSFSYVAPSYVDVGQTVQPGDLASCQAFSDLGAATCREQDFNVSPSYDVIGFGVNGVVAQNLGIIYYFDTSAFTTLGLHNTILFGGDQAGTLLVTDLGSPAGDVPEPSAWALMILGLGAVGGAIRHRRRTLAASAS